MGRRKHKRYPHLSEVRRLPLHRRLASRHARRHLVGVCVGVGLMLVGSTMATVIEPLLPRLLWDAIAYFVHGVGAVPLMLHIEPVWLLVLGAE
jgi:hypothetical protein